METNVLVIVAITFMLIYYLVLTYTLLFEAWYGVKMATKYNANVHKIGEI